MRGAGLEPGPPASSGARGVPSISLQEAAREGFCDVPSIWGVDFVSIWAGQLKGN